MFVENGAWIGSYDKNPVYINPSMANRHGLITGATGTGKTTTLKVMAESFSAMGVPVFMADIKGDCTGICVPGEASEKISERLVKLGVDEKLWEYTGFPTRFWDIFGEKGHPIRVTISEMGPVLLARLLNLSDVQEGVLNLVFHIADERGLLLIDMKDLRAMLSYCAEHRTEFTTDYGNMSVQSIGAIQRALLTLEQQGADYFFGEPALDIHDWIMTDEEGRGYINVLYAAKLVQNPMLYSTFLLWMLSELYEKLPEEGDLDIPKMVFFFDEAHMLFSDAPKALLDKVTQIVKLIRSKGVGVYFISQSPADIPDSVLSQLQNRVQHALHAYTPAEQKAVKVAAQTFRANPAFSTVDAISTMGVGEALLSFLDEDGVPGIVQKSKILPPQSLMKAAPDEIVEKVIAESEMEELYRESFDRRSAYEMLDDIKAEEEEAEAERIQLLEAQEAAAAAEKEAEAKKKEWEKEIKAKQKEIEKQLKEEQKAAEKAAAAEKKAAEAARRKAEQEAAKQERERRKAEAAFLREATKLATKALSGSTKSSSTKSTTAKSSTKSTTKSTTAKKTTTTTAKKTTTPKTTTTKKTTTTSTPSYEAQLKTIGREFGKSIVRGIFGNML